MNMNIDLSGLDRANPYQEETERFSFPVITYKGGTAEIPSIFTLNATQVSRCPLGWKEKTVEFQNKAQLSYVTTRLRGVVLATRKQWEIEKAGTTTRIPWNTPRENWPEGKAKSKVHVLFHIWQGKLEEVEDDINPVVLALNGKARSTAWHNVPERNRDKVTSGWPPGIFTALKTFTAEQADKYSKETGKDTSSFHWSMWIVDIVPEIKEGKQVMRLSDSEFNNRFNIPVLDMSIDKKDSQTGLHGRFIGVEALRKVFDYYEDVGQHWEKEPGWASIVSTDSYKTEDDDDSYSGSSGFGSPIGAEEDEVIPF